MTTRLTLRHAGRAFLDRRGFECRWFGIYLHRIDAPDPGRDLHDHPWPFVSIILRGGYEEKYADTREAPFLALAAEQNERCVGPDRATCRRGFRTGWAVGSIHRMPLTMCHRIVAVHPGTMTLVLRGRKSRQWGFYQPIGWVSHRRYDYQTRRPVDVTRDQPD